MTPLILIQVFDRPRTTVRRTTKSAPQERGRRFERPGSKLTAPLLPLAWQKSQGTLAHIEWLTTVKIRDKSTIVHRIYTVTDTPVEIQRLIDVHPSVFPAPERIHQTEIRLGNEEGELTEFRIPLGWNALHLQTRH